MSILLVGGFGFIGKHVLKKLANNVQPAIELSENFSPVKWRPSIRQWLTAEGSGDIRLLSGKRLCLR